MIRLAIIPIGMSRRGLCVSSAVVETASKPMNAKKRLLPRRPFGIYGCQFVGFTMKAPTQ